jgi:haloalkane dehalogenase
MCPNCSLTPSQGAIVAGRIRDLIRSWPNLTETTVTGLHFVQEDSPDEIGTAVAQFVRKLR